jgi:GntR family transcriptional regulator / MocR family aminotransferase
MKRPPEGLGPAVAVDRRLLLPLHRQIYDGYREAILDGRLRPGQRLPATRTLAQELRVSRIPVVTAFEQLVAEGYLESRVGAGSFVSPELPDVPPARPGKIAPSHRPGPRRIPRARLTTPKTPWLALHGPFRASRPALDEFPAELWGRLVAKHARRLSPLQMGYGDPMGLPALREALAQHLRMVRSVSCAPEQIMVVSGSQQALALSSQALLEPGDGVWLEEPGYEGARDALKVAAARIVPVPVDEGGLDVAAGIARGPDAKAAYITPSHQYPLGMIMSAPRRLQLLEWARKQGAWLFEDDYDSEYRYDGQGLSSLQGLDGDARVIYIGTFSKVLFPALRVGYLVIPRDLVARFRRLRGAMDISQEPFQQAVLAELIREGHYARHLRRMRGIYSERRRVLEDALARELPALRVSGDNAGMHLVLLLPARVRDHDIALRAALEGISVIPLSSCYTGRKTRPGLILGYGSTRLSEIPDAVRRLKGLLHT